MVYDYDIAIVGLSDTGKVRDTNQDNYFKGDFNPNKQTLLTLFDGAGGHEGGEIASGCGAEVSRQVYANLDSYLTDENQANAGEQLVNNIAFATQKGILEKVGDILNKNPRSEVDPTTTYVGLYFNPIGIANYAHVGDSRLYLLRDGVLTKLTEDHNLAYHFLSQKAKKTGEPFDEEAYKAHPRNNIVTKSIQKDKSNNIDDGLTDVSYVDIRVGDLYLLCSDGLTDMLNERTRRELDSDKGKMTIRSIEEILNQTVNEGEVTSERKLQQCANGLIYEANRAGGHDNITVVLARVNGMVDQTAFTSEEDGFFNNLNQQASSEQGKPSYDQLEDQYREVYNAYLKERNLRKELQTTTNEQGSENARLSNDVNNLQMTVESYEFENANLEAEIAERDGIIKEHELRIKGLQRENDNYKRHPHKQGRNPRIVGLLAGVALCAAVYEGSQYFVEHEVDSSIAEVYDSFTKPSVEEFEEKVNGLKLQFNVGMLGCGDLRYEQDSLNWDFTEDEVYGDLDLFRSKRSELESFIENKCPELVKE